MHTLIDYIILSFAPNPFCTLNKLIPEKSFRGAVRDILTKHGIIEIFEIPHELRFLVDSNECKIDAKCLGYSSSIDHITLIKEMIEVNNEK